MTFLNGGIGLGALTVTVILSTFHSSVIESFLTLIKWGGF